MPLLEDLVQELQQRLSAQSSSIPSSAAVAEAAQSERINVTLPGGVMEDGHGVDAPCLKHGVVGGGRGTGG